jgi:hypothetical protein
MLGTDTAQPELDFKRTAFAAVSILDGSGTQLARLSVQANPGDDGAFGDIVSGPHALAFSDDGKLAFVVDTNSEDVLVIDAEQRIETQLLRPLPGHMPESVVFAAGKIYIQERNTEDIAAFRVERADMTLTLVPEGPAFRTRRSDPMPGELRLGQKLFYSANSDDLALTQNHWIACATCHLEGRSDAVTWQFSQGPRDTPSNAGGLLDTGFLFRTADRVKVQDYWRTINVEQGGHFSRSPARRARGLRQLGDPDASRTLDRSHARARRRSARFAACARCRAVCARGLRPLPHGGGAHRLRLGQSGLGSVRIDRRDGDARRRAAARRGHVRERRGRV